MKYLQESRKKIYFASALLGAFLVFVPIVDATVAPTGWLTNTSTYVAGPAFAYTGSGNGTVSATNSHPNALFFANSSTIICGTPTSNMSMYNFLGTGGNNTYVLYAGNDTTQYVATGTLNNRFNITSGSGNSTFSLVSGRNTTVYHSIFYIQQQNLWSNTVCPHATQSFAVTAGMDTYLNESSYGTILAAGVYNTFYNINLGTNSTVLLSSDFQGNSSINVIF